MQKHHDKKYHRFHIETKKAENIIAHPHRFNVKVNRPKLAKLLLKELIHYRGKKEVILSRPCVYGVFSGPLGGFAPRENLCVGCLRCTTQYPDMVQILKNPERAKLGDGYFTPEYFDTVVHEAETGRVPIKGAGYRGAFGGTGWDGMWTDMSEIVRPTRDGIHGREFISTSIDIGGKPSRLKFDAKHEPQGPIPQTVSIPLPFLFDLLPSMAEANENVCHIVSEAAHHLQTFAVFSLEAIRKFSLKGPRIIPLINSSELDSFMSLGTQPLLLEMNDWDESFYQNVKARLPETLVILRTAFENVDPIEAYSAGARIFHFTADYHGRGKSGRFVLDLIKNVQQAFVNEKCRDEVSLIGSGGIIAAEHMAKAIICGLDAVALDTPILAALQARFLNHCTDRTQSQIQLPPQLPLEWGKQRLKNMAGSWHDQLLEVMGAMGLREVRRLRGEIGRAMFQKDLEREAFAGIDGYGS